MVIIGKYKNQFEAFITDSTEVINIKLDKINPDESHRRNYPSLFGCNQRSNVGDDSYNKMQAYESDKVMIVFTRDKDYIHRRKTAVMMRQFFSGDFPVDFTPIKEKAIAPKINLCRCPFCENIVSYEVDLKCNICGYNTTVEESDKFLDHFRHINPIDELITDFMPSYFAASTHTPNK